MITKLSIRQISIGVVAFLTLLGILRGLAFTFTPLTLSWKSYATLHPIEKLHLEAKQSFQKLISRQSIDVESAFAQYRLRYREEPPPGFGNWVLRAKELQSPIIDDFDLTRESLTPFKPYLDDRLDLNLTDADRTVLFEERVLQACVGDSTVTFEGFKEPWYFEAVERLFWEAAQEVPKVCVFLNTFDEPRVLLNSSESSRLDVHTLNFENIDDHRNLWPQLSHSCANRNPDPPPTFLEKIHSSITPSSWRPSITKYAENWFRNTDICQQAGIHHSFIESPESASLTSLPVPILSTAKLSPFSDILFPSVFRFEEAPDLDKIEEPSWDDKLSSVYWRGSTTGGHASIDNWRRLHRQELVMKMNEKVTDADNIDVTFTSIIQCEEDACQDQERVLPKGERQSLSEAWKHRIVLDVDGNGLSGRLYKLLRSSSVVLRWSMMREWHDERLLPWLHYIPLTKDAGEFPELVRFLLHTERGDAILQTIAKESKAWADRSLRPEDMALYAWRLVLEMGRERQSV